MALGKSMLENDEDSDDSDSESPNATSGTTTSSQQKLDLFANSFDVYVKKGQKLGGFFKQSQSYYMFPYQDKRRRFDDYGEAIVPENFMRELDVANNLISFPADGSNVALTDFMVTS